MNTVKTRPFRRGLVVLLLVAMLFSLNAASLAAAPNPGSAAPAAEKVEVLIGFHGAPNPGLVRAFGGEIYREFTIVDAVAARMPQQAADALARHKSVRYVELDGPVYALGQTVPWGIDRVFGDESYSFDTWGITRGGGVAVAILDTGIDENHEDLPKLLGGVNTIDDTHWGSDGSGHGTHVAGTVAALDNEVGVVGVGPQIGLYAVKVLDDGGGGTIKSVVAGIEWVAQQDIPIMNMSLGTGTHYQTLQDACDAANSAGHLLVSSAGNSGNPPGRGDNVGYPAAYESVIAVAASRHNDTRASFSSTGPDVELIAPGESIFSTIPGDKYGTKSGTSMASPHVAGVAALVWAASSDSGEPDIDVRDSVRSILQDTAEDLGLSPNHQGYGLVRADLAVRAASPVTPVVTHTLTLEANPAESGTLEGGGDYEEGTEVTVTATANPGYQFVNWTKSEGDDVEVVSEESSFYYTMPAEDVTLAANFEEVPTFTLTLEVEPEGAGTVTGAGEYEEDATVTVTATANSGYRFVDWTEGGNEVSAQPEFDYTMPDENVTLTANFEPTGIAGPVIDIFELTDTSNPAWARVTVEWAVSSDIGLAAVESVMRVKDDEKEIDSKTTTVSGSEASGTHEFRVRGGHGVTYEVTLTVTDTDGDSVSEKKEITL